ncbi:FtsQ-type POTRA domain-containing protein [Leucobacter sp. HY1910]
MTEGGTVDESTHAETAAGAPPESPLQGDRADGGKTTPGVVATVTGDVRTGVSRALTWVGVGAPKDPVRAADRRLRQAARARRRSERRERRRFADQLRKQRRGLLVAGGTIAALALFVALCAFTPLTAVRDVQVSGAAAVPEADLHRALSRFEGVPLALVDDGEVHAALEVFPLIQRYKVERVPPHTLRVQVEERLPVIAIESDGGFDHFDAAGVKVGVSEGATEGVPVGQGAISDLASPAFGEAARIIRDIPTDLRAQVSTVEASGPQDITLILTSGLRVAWGDDTHTARKAVVLQTMLGALGDRPLELIDVSSPDAPVFR